MSDRNPPRQLGRLDDENWQILKDAAEAEGQSFSRWAIMTLLKAAAKERKAREQTGGLL